ncbi:MAG: CehA/McbA family metallohydrolase [Clostridiales bacterium]|nr:CehA/McbA family metallohydrolase [Clostridiales bacterium]
MQPTINDFTRRIDRREMGQYLRVPFIMPPDADTLRVTYSYERHRLHDEGDGRVTRDEINIVDLALEKPGYELVGASGSNRQEITLHENYATPGYHPHRLTPGTWHIILGAYQIEEAGCPVKIRVEIMLKQGLLVKGDTHTHTVHSDGWYTVEEAIERARGDRMDFLFLTDHNSMASNPLVRSYPDLTVIPGVEITYYGGHYNLFGVQRPVKTYVANTRDEVLTIMAEGRYNKALCSVNHPTDANCPWTFGLGEDVPVDMVEIWNGPYTPWNQKAIDLWQEHLCAGRIWPAIGGSDVHHSELFRTYGTPTTFLYTRSRGASDILDAMRKGHAFVGMHPEAPHIHLGIKDARMGDVYHGEPSPLRLQVGPLSATDEVLVINQTGVLWRQTPGKCHLFEAEVSAHGSRFLRVEVRRELPNGLPTLASISNPIYINPVGG